jgi:riboflavin kinase / FMN adenylyltransferase
MTRVHTSIASLAGQAPGCTIALGAFDGLHLGHQALLAQARRAAPQALLVLAVFEPPPKIYFRPDAPASRLTTPRVRARVARDLGVDHVLELTFDAAMATMDAEVFASDLIAGQLTPAHLVVGHDFRFGRGRAGNTDMLAEVADQAGFGFSVVAPVVDGSGTRISSTRIREALQAGEITAANTMLGRPWMIEAEVVHGEKRGRTIGYPTANMVLGDQLAPRFGIYVVTATLPDGTGVRGVANFGRTPTTGLRDPLLEVFLLDFDQDLYGQRLEIAFHEFLRPEAMFDGLEALVAQIDQDAADTRAWFASHG